MRSDLGQQRRRDFCWQPRMVAVDESFEVAPGIHSKQRELVQEYNFGVVQIIPTGGTSKVIPAIMHSGESSSAVLQLRS